MYKLAGRMDLSAVLSFTDFTGLLPVFVADLSFFPATHRSLSVAESSLDISELVSQNWCSIAWKIL